MLTRVGDFAQHQRMAQLLLDAQTRAREAQVQIGTGKVAQRFREVAPDADRLLATKDALYQIRQFRANNELAAKRLEVMESSVGSLHEVGTRLKVLLIQRLDAGSAVPGVITPELQHLLERAVSNLNVDFNGRFLSAAAEPTPRRSRSIQHSRHSAAPTTPTTGATPSR